MGPNARSASPLSRRVGFIAAGLVLVGLTAGCSGSGGIDSLAEGAGGSAERAGIAEAADQAARPGDLNRVAVQTRAVIRTGQLAITSEDLGQTRDEVDDLLAALDATIDSERTSHDRFGRIERSTLVIRVPVARFDAAVDAMEKLGTLKSSDRTAKDVTTEVIDVNERVETIRTSLDRLQGFLRRSRDIDDVVRFEREITHRESELASLESQQAYLLDRTAMSTVTLHLSTPEKYVAPPDALADAGFMAGLKSGWNALVDTVVVALTVLGAVLPFSVPLALVGIPVLLLVRHRRGASLPTMPEEPAT